MPNKLVMVRFQVAQLNVDPVQYKPYSHTLLAENVFVDIPVDKQEVNETGKQIILTVDGLAALLKAVAEPIQNMSDEARKQKFGH